MKILVVRLSSLGDVLHLFPAITDLQTIYTGAEIHWLIEPSLAEVAGWHQAISKVITVPLRAHKKTWWKIPSLLRKLRRQLRAERYDMVLDAQGLIKSAWLAHLAGAPVWGFDKTGAREALATRFYQHQVNIPEKLHVIEKNRRLIAALGTNQYDTSAASAEFGLDQFSRQQSQQPLPPTLQALTQQPYWVLLHGTTWQSKYWPETAWHQLVRQLTANGQHCALPWGNADEYARAQRLQATGGELATLLPKLSLTELTRVLLHAQGFVSVETGIGHLAAILDVPGVTIHGPTDPNWSGILGRACIHLQSNLDCSPCFNRNCPISQAVHAPCQQAISAEQVYARCMQLKPAA